MFVLLLPLPLAYFRASELFKSCCVLLGILFDPVACGWGGRESICKEIWVIAMCHSHIPALLWVYPPKQQWLCLILPGWQSLSWVVSSIWSLDLLHRPWRAELEQWFQEDFPWAGSVFGTAVPRARLAEVWSGFRTVWSGLRDGDSSGFWMCPSKLITSFWFPLEVVIGSKCLELQ